MPNVVSDFLIKHIDLLDKKTLALIIDSIELHLVDYAEYEPYPSLWRNLEERLKARQSVLDTEEGGTK